MGKERKRLTEAEAKAREERLNAMGVTVERPTGSTITLLVAETTEKLDGTTTAGAKAKELSGDVIDE